MIKEEEIVEGLWEVGVQDVEKLIGVREWMYKTGKEVW